MRILTKNGVRDATKEELKVYCERISNYKTKENNMEKFTQAFFLVECGSGWGIISRHLFKTNQEAKNFCEKQLGLKYCVKNAVWKGAKNDKCEAEFYANIITLALETINN